MTVSRAIPLWRTRAAKGCVAVSRGMHPGVSDLSGRCRYRRRGPELVQHYGVAAAGVPSVYDEVPLKGIVVWNSHAFNLLRSARRP